MAVRIIVVAREGTLDGVVVYVLKPLRRLAVEITLARTKCGNRRDVVIHPILEMRTVPHVMHLSAPHHFIVASAIFNPARRFRDRIFVNRLLGFGAAIVIRRAIFFALLTAGAIPFAVARAPGRARVARLLLTTLDGQ